MRGKLLVCTCMHVGVSMCGDLNQVHADNNTLVLRGTMEPFQRTIKLGGDKSHRSFKFSVQLMNFKHRNSHKNTALISVYKAGDSTTNLHTALDMYQEHVTEMQGMRENVYV